MSRFPDVGTTLYRGSYVSTDQLPWHYIPVWLTVSSPLMYSFFFVAGLFFGIKRSFLPSGSWDRNKRDTLIIFIWFFAPIAAVVAFRSVLYDGWRQAFFIYPAFLLIALTGLKNILEITEHNPYRWIRTGLAILVAIEILWIAGWMVRHHPYQNVYFNSLAGKNMADIKEKYEMDYWGLSYRKALEYILAHDQGTEIKVFVANSPGTSNAYILPKEERARLVFVKQPQEAGYFVSNYRWHKEDYPLPNKVFTVEIDGASIMVVHKLM